MNLVDRYYTVNWQRKDGKRVSKRFETLELANRWYSHLRAAGYPSATVWESRRWA